MSFFNLTHTGVQDPFKTAAHAKTDAQSQPPLSDSAATESRAAATHVETMYCSSETGETGRGWHSGSHCRYTELLRKHQRHPQGPMELYQHPLTTSSEYGWWLKDGSPHREEWAGQSEQHVHVNSEMTQFVDDMSLTNKEFSLY